MLRNFINNTDMDTCLPMTFDTTNKNNLTASYCHFIFNYFISVWEVSLTFVYIHQNNLQIL